MMGTVEKKQRAKKEPESAASFGCAADSRVYEPAEDSYLLERNISKFARGTVLDMGTGSGIQAVKAAKTADMVMAADINPEALKAAERNITKIRDMRGKKKPCDIRFVRSDLFTAFEPGKTLFDLIIFNPPYLPDHPQTKDIALDGGRHGHELSVRFLEEAPDFLSEDGKILFLFSSLTGREMIDSTIRRSLMKAKLIDQEKLDFEELYVYLIEKQQLRIRLEERGVKNIRFFAKGHRGNVHIGFLEEKKIAIKSKLAGSQAMGRIEIETGFLRRLNPHDIGPRLLFSSSDENADDRKAGKKAKEKQKKSEPFAIQAARGSEDGYFAYEFVAGKPIEEHIINSSKKDIIDMIGRLFLDLRKLDLLGINKQEMHHPVKHIIVGKDGPVMIDFERARFSQKPHNITQFCQYLMHISQMLSEKAIIVDKDKLKKLCRDYSKNYKDRELKKIVACIR